MRLVDGEGQHAALVMPNRRRAGCRNQGVTPFHREEGERRSLGQGGFQPPGAIVPSRGDGPVAHPRHPGGRGVEAGDAYLQIREEGGLEDTPLGFVRQDGRGAGIVESEAPGFGHVGAGLGP
jgi:hypothetical protein